MDRIINKNDTNPNTLNPITLAYLGDAVFEVLVREYIALKGDKSPEKLHKEAVSFVSAQAQAKWIGKIAPLLSEDETAAFKRGRNAKVSHIPKGASVATYHAATGFEALYGYLFLTGQSVRMRELFDIICKEEASTDE